MLAHCPNCYDPQGHHYWHLRLYYGQMSALKLTSYYDKSDAFCLFLMVFKWLDHVSLIPSFFSKMTLICQTAATADRLTPSNLAILRLLKHITSKNPQLVFKVTPLPTLPCWSRWGPENRRRPELEFKGSLDSALLLNPLQNILTRISCSSHPRRRSGRRPSVTHQETTGFEAWIHACVHSQTGFICTYENIQTHQQHVSLAHVTSKHPLFIKQTIQKDTTTAPGFSLCLGLRDKFREVCSSHILSLNVFRGHRWKVGWLKQVLWPHLNDHIKGL